MLTGIATALGGTGCGAERQAEPDAPTGRLVVEQKLVPGGPIPTEGTFGFYELIGDQPDPVARGNIPTARRGLLVDRRLPAGDYTLVSYQRPCLANCGRLGAPVGRCEQEIRVEAGERLDVSVRVRHGDRCTIVTR